MGSLNLQFSCVVKNCFHFYHVLSIYKRNAYLSQLSSKIPKEDNGHLKFADGTLIQWGRATVGSNGAATVDFGTPFINTSYCIQATPEYYSGTPTFTLSTQRSTVSRMIIYARSTAGAVISGVNVYWMVIGRWK